jgi:heat shock protein HslJ
MRRPYGRADFNNEAYPMTALRIAALLTLFAFSTATHGQTAGRGGPAAQAPQPRQMDKIFPLGASWIAVSLNGRPFTGERPSFTIDQRLRATGFGGCRNFTTVAYPLREQGLAVGPFELTRKSCSKDVMAREEAFLVALRTAAKWEQQGSTLVLRSPNGELRFERAL